MNECTFALAPIQFQGCLTFPHSTVQLVVHSAVRKTSQPNFHDHSDEIIKIAKERKAKAIIPGYGFLSENSDFARSVAAAGMVFIGPSPEAIESFGLKHKARELAVKAGVPIVPGTEGLIQNEAEAVRESERLGFPVMLKATAGGGGMGLSTCKDVKDVKEAFATVKSRGENLFKNAGVFIERYYVRYEPCWEICY